MSTQTSRPPAAADSVANFNSDAAAKNPDGPAPTIAT